jgi:hypothetical protein
MRTYERKDFLSLTKFAKLQADSLDDEPDLCLSLQDAANAGVRIAVKSSVIGDEGHICYWLNDGQWVYDEDLGARGWLFLPQDCIDHLLSAGGLEVEWSHFIVDGQSLRLASQQDVAIENGLATPLAKQFSDHFSADRGYRFAIDALYLLRGDVERMMPTSIGKPLMQQQFSNLHNKPKEQHEWMLQYEEKHGRDTSQPLADDVLIPTQDFDRVLAAKFLGPDQEDTGREGRAKSLVNDLIVAYVKQSEGNQPPSSLKQLFLWSKENEVQGYGFVKVTGKGNDRHIEVRGRCYCRYSACAGAFKKSKKYK